MNKILTTNEKDYRVIYNKDGSFNRIKILKDIFESKEKTIQKVIGQNLRRYIGQYAYITESGQKIYFEKDLLGEYSYSNSTKNLPVTSKLAKGRIVVALQEIINYAQNKSWEANKKEKHKLDAKYGFYRYNITFSFEYKGKEQVYQGIILIRNDKNGKKYLYDIIKVKKIGSNLPLVVSNPLGFNYV